MIRVAPNSSFHASKTFPVNNLSNQDKLTDAYKGFRKITIVLKILGFFPVEGLLRKDKVLRLKYCSWSFFYSCLLCSGYVTSLCYFLFKRPEMKKIDNITKSLLNISHYLVLGTRSISIISIFLFCFRCPSHFQKWGSLEPQLKRTLGSINNRIHFSLSSLGIVILLVVAIAEVVFFLIRVQILLHIFIFLICPMFTIRSAVISIIACFVYFCQIYGEYITHISKAIDNPKYWNNNLGHLHYSYSSLLILLNDAIEMFSPFFCITFISIGLNICTHGYMAITNQIGFHIILAAFWETVGLATIVYSAHRLKKKIDDLQFILLNAAARTNDKEKQVKIRDFSWIVVSSAPSTIFHGCGLVYINSQTINAMIGVIISYLVLLIQMKSGDSSCTKASTLETTTSAH